MSEKLDIITIGESLIELSTNENLKDANILEKYYGGDTLSSAITALRLGSKVGFISRLGNDCFKDYLIESWQKEKLDITQVIETAGVNGLYIVSKSQDYGMKELAFYRKKTAATSLSIDDISSDYIQNSSILYSTGITQSLSISAREAVKTAFKIANDNNVITAYDPNFLPIIWAKEEAKEAFDEIAEFLDIVFLNTKYDLQIIIDSSSIENVIKHLWDKGINKIIVKSSEDKGYYVGYQGKVDFVKYYTDIVVDNTSSGDVFNGAVLHGLIAGLSILKAVNLGAITAGLQVQKFGAIKSIPSKDEVYKIFKGQNV